MEVFNDKKTLNSMGQIIDLTVPKVMGIVNVTPDSFFKDSRTTNNRLILERVDTMIAQGADIIDLGAYSSRPGAENVPEKKEWERLEPALDVIRQKYPSLIISVDTFRSGIVRNSVEKFNVNLINDISGGELDPDMYSVVGQYKLPYILMHMKGTPQDMQLNPVYKHLLNELIAYFVERIEKLINCGIMDIIIDPGFGFGKTLDHNYELIARLHEFKVLECPMLVGVSRKSMIYKFLNITQDEALNGTSVINTMALMSGAQILRVHDVQQAVESVKLFIKVQESAN